MDGSLFAPQWAVARRNELVEATYQEVADSGLLHSDCILLAFARYIAAHEEPPVDPLLNEARKLIAESNVFRTNNQMQAILDGHAGTLQVSIALAALRRGIELCSKGDTDRG